MSVLKEEIKKLNRKNTNLENKLPIKVIQFGEGNFLRAFVDFAFQKLNKELNFNAGIAVVQPIDRGLINMLNDQDGLYTLFTKGINKGEIIQDIELISNIVKGVDVYANFDEFLSLAKEEELQFIISNTTESGIAYIDSDLLEMKPPASFPAKLLVLLHERFNHFRGDKSKGLTIIPCELINHNSDTLKDILLKYSEDWKLSEAFKEWLLTSCSFHNTLVDRIVPGYPKDQIEEYNSQLDYKDNLIVSAETFFLWVIEGDDKLKEKLPFHKTNLDVKIVKNMQPYRTRKVRILNGAHTSIFALSLLYGNETVKETVENEFTTNFISKIVYDEIIKTLTLDKEELNNFASEVFDRFRNPFVKHQLASLSLNAISKFKVRVLPSLLEFVSIHNRLPKHLTFAFACLIRFYKATWDDKILPVNDDNYCVDAFKIIWKLSNTQQVSETVLKTIDFWGQDLTKITGLTQAIALALEEIDANGIEKGFANFSKQYKED